MASSLDRLAGYHHLQIEPNEQGSKVIGRLIAEAVAHQFGDGNKQAIFRLLPDGFEVQKEELTSEQSKNFSIRSLEDFICSNRCLRAIFYRDRNFSNRLENAYHFFAGRHFDMQYTRIFPLGLIDISIVTILAAYLWRHAINQKEHLITRIPAAIIAAPILLARCVVAVICTLAVSPFIGLLHLLLKACREKPSIEFVSLFRQKGPTSREAPNSISASFGV
jgi:hypothetical protein